MKELPDISCAYGISDEYRYYTGSRTVSLAPTLYLASCSTDQVGYSRGERGKRAESRHGTNLILIFLFSKILTTVVSTFTSYYIHLWPHFFADEPLSPPMPSFDGRVVLYPSAINLRDYMSWRQVDCMSSRAVRKGERYSNIPQVI